MTWNGKAPAGFLAVLLLANAAWAMILVGYGNDPVRDQNWPAGAVEVANLKRRVGWWEGPPFGGGEHTFLYRGDAVAFQQALETFAKVIAPDLQVFVWDGPFHSEFLKNNPKDPRSDTRVDWSFTVWNARQWHQLYDHAKNNFLAADPNFGKPLPSPWIDVYIGGGQIDWSKVKVPKGVKVVERRADAAGYPGGSAVVGDVYDMLTSKPVVGAAATVAKSTGQESFEPIATAKTDASGHFVLQKLPAGSFRISVSADGYASRVLGYEKFRANTLDRQTVKLAPAASLSGTVTDTTGKPLSGITVRPQGMVTPDGQGYTPAEKIESHTDAAGHFVLEHLPQGTAMLFVYGGSFQQLDVLASYPVPSKDVHIRMTATGTIRGKVLNADGSPAGPGANVNVEPPGDPIGKWGGSMNVKPDGTFEFESVPPGEYFVSTHPMPPGKIDPNAKKVLVKAGQTVEVDVKEK